MRTPNSECVRCGKKYYRRPASIMYRAICYGCQKIENAESWTTTNCIKCGKEFSYQLTANHGKPRKTCSRTCSNYNRTGMKYDKSQAIDKQNFRLWQLKQKFNFDSCMIEGCDYNKTYDVHRLIPGKLGGEYEIGNMFAICPNHHAECHRGICKLEKIDDSHLKAIYGEMLER